MGVCVFVFFSIHLRRPPRTPLLSGLRAGTPEVHLPAVSVLCLRAPPPVAARCCLLLPTGAYPAGSETCRGRNFSGNPPHSHTRCCPSAPRHGE